MKTTIDQAGRIVISAVIRNKAGFKPGTEQKIVMDDICIRPVHSGPTPKLVCRGKRLIAKPAARAKEQPEFDRAARVKSEWSPAITFSRICG